MKALFLDRDGVINVEKEYLHTPEAFEFIDGLFDTLRLAQSLGYLLVVVTNQSGIGRGYYSEADFLTLNRWMCAQLENEGISIAKVYYCPHAPEAGCDCRKPLPGMLNAAVRDFGIDPAASLLVGDKEADIEAGKAAGIGRCILVRSGHKIDESNTRADAVIDSVETLPPYL